jgi:hypothetical protein
MSARMMAWPLLLAIAMSSVATPARAEEPSDEEVQRRISFLQQRLDQGTAAADRWWYAWYSIFTGLAVGQAVIAIAVTDPDLRTDNVVGAFASSLGVVPLGFSPLEARFAGDRLRALPESTPDQRRKKLAQGEGILRSAAEQEQFGRSWVSLLLGNSVALAFGIVLGVGYERPVSGVINFAGGVVITELQILTQPTQAIDDWHQYRRHGPPADQGPEPSRWVVAPQAGGLSVGACF